MPGELFTHITPDREISRRNLIASIVLHIIAINVLVFWRHIDPFTELSANRKKREHRVLHYNLPDHLLFAQAGKKPAPPKKSHLGPRRPAKVARKLPQPPKLRPELPKVPKLLAQIQKPVPLPPKPKFKLPELKPVEKKRDLILQAENQQIRIEDKVDLPNLLLWAQRQIQGPRRDLKSFVLGQPQKTPVAPAVLSEATPRVDLASRAPQVGELKLGMTPQAPERGLKSYVLGQTQRAPVAATVLSEVTPRLEVAGQASHVSDLKVGMTPQAPERGLKSYVPGQTQRAPLAATVLSDVTPRLEVAGQASHVSDLNVGVMPQAPSRGGVKSFVLGQPRRAPAATTVLPDATPRLEVAGQASHVSDLKVGATPQAPSRGLKSFVLGQPQRAPAATTVLSDATPRLEVAGQASQVSDLKVGVMPQAPSRGTLRVFSTPATPVRVAERRVLDAPAGLPVNVRGTTSHNINLVAIMEKPAPPAAKFSVPAGNRYPETEPESADQRENGNRAGGERGGPQNGGDVSGPSRGSGSGAGSLAGGQGLAVEDLNLRGRPDSFAIRTETPNRESFEVVVVRQNRDELLAESLGVLSGQPIYTVYMLVPGSPREWVLQYAIPNSREPIQGRTRNATQVGATAPVTAPYPLRKASLELGRAARMTGRVVLYALINQKGSVENPRVIRGAREEIDKAVMACLRQFLFRPAVQNGAPVLVEAIFGVPLN